MTQIRIASVPWGAKIWIDKQYRGTTILQDCSLKTGSHLLEFRMGDEYQKKEIIVSLDTKGFVWNIGAQTIFEIQQD